MNNANASTNKSFQIVAAMNSAFGNPAATPDTVDYKRLTKQCFNIKSEINELKKAINSKDMLGVRDALCDICVFAYGGHHFMGIAGWEVRVTNAPRSFATFAAAITELEKTHAGLMQLLESDNRSAYTVAFYLDRIVNTAAGMQESIGADHDTDMQAVIDGVMTRFVKDEADKEATIAKHAAAGVTQVYFEGDYPTMIMKSAIDQGDDAPQGKFLKSASFREPIFAPIELQPWHVQLVDSIA